jgi:glycosyl transferase family 87
MEPPAIHLPTGLTRRPAGRRAGVLRRAIRRELSRLRDRRRLLAIALLVLTFGLTAAGMLARGEAAGADARAYWAGVRFWLNGGDPYHPAGPFLPYVYAPWMLPLFAPWALLPWDVAWFVWRGGTILALLWSIDWAYRSRPLATAITIAVLAFPIGANLDTGNVTLLIALALFGAQFMRPRLAGAVWALATWMKWAPAMIWIVLAPRARLWGLGWLGASALLSLATLPLTITQFVTLFSFDRPLLRLDYLVLLWAFVPWLWRRQEPFTWLRPSSWRAATGRVASWARGWARRLTTNPADGGAAARRGLSQWARGVLGIEAPIAGDEVVTSATRPGHLPADG